ncbi:pyridoxal phosphate-dependent aminotransferase [Pseudonocardia nematodicida]|uniref:Aminotransferase n=1 Tax=Pseudonocardia nematodicida TaxID=1206997 RepID=A0ABV1KIU1_9PSEU
MTPVAATSAPPRDRISARVGALTPSATLAVDARAKALRAAGRSVIGFGAGEPDFPTPRFVVEAAAAACAEPENHRYTPAAGLPELRAAVAGRRGSWVEGSDVLITNGGKQAVYQALATVVDPGDEVLVPAPFWTTYPEAVRLAGGIPVPVPASADDGYLPTPDSLEAARTGRTRALLWCSPSNPTGAVAPEPLVEAIGRWASDSGLWVIADEIYEHLVYDDTRHVSMPDVVPALRDTCIVVNGVAKTYAMTGWRVGWLHGPRDVVAAATRLQSHLSSNVNNVAQRAAVAALTGPGDGLRDMLTAFDRRRHVACEALNSIEGVHCPTPRGAFYVFASVHGILGRDLCGRRIDTSADLAEALLDHAEVAVVPGEAFGAPGHLRLSYALGDDQLHEGLGRIRDLLSTGS